MSEKNPWESACSWAADVTPATRSQLSGRRRGYRPSISPMRLPTELIDEILDHLPSDDEESLRSCSLVAKSWLDPCQRRLFEAIIIDMDTYQPWFDNISPTNTELLRHVQQLMYVPMRKKDPRYPPYRIGDDFRVYLPSFCQLQYLIFGLVDIESIIPDHKNLFFAFQHTLFALSLLRVSTTWNGLVTLLGYFPNLKNLEICEVSLDVDARPAPHLPRALRGRLFVRCDKEMDQEPLIDRFAGLKLEYEELVIMGDYDQRLVAAVESTLKRLRIGRRTCTLPHHTHHLTAYTSDLTSQRTSLWISHAVQNFASWSSCYCSHERRSGFSSPPSPPKTSESSFSRRGFHTLSGTSSCPIAVGYCSTI